MSRHLERLGDVETEYLKDKIRSAFPGILGRTLENMFWEKVLITGDERTMLLHATEQLFDALKLDVSTANELNRLLAGKRDASATEDEKQFYIHMITGLNCRAIIKLQNKLEIMFAGAPGVADLTQEAAHRYASQYDPDRSSFIHFLNMYLPPDVSARLKNDKQRKANVRVLSIDSSKGEDAQNSAIKSWLGDERQVQPWRQPLINDEMAKVMGALETLPERSLGRLVITSLLEGGIDEGKLDAGLGENAQGLNLRQKILRYSGSASMSGEHLKHTALKEIKEALRCIPDTDSNAANVITERFMNMVETRARENARG